jgi:DNA processing protein
MQEYWLAFMQVRGMGPMRLRAIRSQFESIQAAWFAHPDQLNAFLPSTVIEQWVLLRRSLQPMRLLDAVYQAGAWVLTLDDDGYPPLLQEVEDGPPVLYGLGQLLPADHKALAVVGTRRASAYGKEMTRQLVTALTAEGITIVSGLAHGIDSQAHQTALDYGGRTIAVLGCGINVIYPSDNRHLAQRIQEQGALVTEFPLGIQPLPAHFPARNRIMSGLSLGVLVVEAPEKSGSLNTAQYAGEQGREVFAVPGNANQSNSRGANLLIQDGAKLVMEAGDILRELNISQQAAHTRQTVKRIVPANPLEAQLLELLALEGLHVDDLSRQSGLSIQEVNVALVLMELKGMVYQIAPMLYQRVN